jgi:two-component system, NarL family, sensor kinase
VVDRATQELGILNAVAEALNSAPDVRQALQRTLALVADLLGLRTGWVWLRDPETRQFYSAAAQNLPPYLQEPVRMTGSPCWCILAFQDGELTPKNINVLECSRLYPAVQAGAVDLTEGLSCHASIPLYFRETPLGIMNLAGPTWRRLDRTELRLLSTIGYQVGIAIERARLAEAAQQMARIEERTRIAREIHDTLAQDLTAIGLHIEGALRFVDIDPGIAKGRLEKALATSRGALEQARLSVLNLRSEPVLRPFSEELGSRARVFTSETGVRARLRTSGLVDLPEHAELELVSLFQEALTNIRRHASASEVDITLRGDARMVRLSIRDNGRGFDPKIATAGHHGIVGMRERTRLLHGRLRVTSKSGVGTTVTATVPAAGEDDV